MLLHWWDRPVESDKHKRTLQVRAHQSSTKSDAPCTSTRVGRAAAAAAAASAGAAGITVACV